MISQAITFDKEINDLSDDTSRLAFTWLITFADVEGRTHGDPAIVRSKLFPRRDDITIERMEGYIREWAAHGLIILYEAKGEWWIYFPAFCKHNRVDKTREAPSRIPEPTPDLLVSNSGVTPEEVHVKLKQIKLNQIKLKEGGGDDDLALVVREYEQNIGLLTPMIRDEILELLTDTPPKMMVDAIQVAVTANVRRMSYVKGVLRRWREQGYSNNGKLPVPSAIAGMKSAHDEA